MAIINFVNYSSRSKSSQSRGCMRSVMKYVAQDAKTQWQGRQLVTGVNCQAQSAYDDFLNTKLLYHKGGGRMFYHLVQSFPSGAEVDPDKAHAAALKLAEQFKDHEVLVCTHTDRDHVHSHLIPLKVTDHRPVPGSLRPLLNVVGDGYLALPPFPAYLARFPFMPQMPGES